MSRRSAAKGLVVLVACLGCGRSGTVPTAEVTGTVTYKESPVDKAVVTFFPKQGRPATGLTDAQGRFTLSTFKAGDGAVLGKHAVTISDPWPVKPPPLPERPGVNPYQEPKPRFPAKYADPNASPFAATVEEGKNKFNFDMTE